MENLKKQIGGNNLLTNQISMSNFLKLNIQDLIKGLVVSILSAVITLILGLLQNGMSIDWKTVGITALIAGLSYILKNFLSSSDGNKETIAGIKISK